MIIDKKILIHEQPWRLEFKSFGDSVMGLRFVLNMTCISNTKKSLTFYKLWSRYRVYYDYSDTPAIFDTLLEARVAILKYLLHENIQTI